MKIISGIFKLIAVLIMIVVVAALPVSLLMRDLGNLLFSPETMAALLEENIFDAEVLAGLAEYYVQEVFEEREGENPYGELMAEGVGNLSHKDWVRVINLITPPKLIADTFEQTMRGYYRWLDGPDPFPQIVIDLEPWKRNISRNSVPVLELVMNALPQCTPDQLAQFGGLATGGSIAEVPICRPPEPIYSLALDQAAEALPEQLAQMPKSIDIGRQIRQNRDDLADAKQRLLGARAVMRRSWIVVALLFLVGVPMGARSIPGAFKWAGWPLALAGVFGVMVAVLMMLLAESLAAGVEAAVIEGVPPPLIAPISSVAVGWTLSLARPFLVQSAALVLFGGGAIIAGALVGRYMSNNQGAAASASTITGGAPAADAGPSGETLKKPEREVDDDSKPTGMFG